MTLAIVSAFLTGYLLGSVPFSYLAGRLRGVDLRRHGSGNLGASNAYRVLGAGAGISVLALDVVKGTAAVLLAGCMASRAGVDAAEWLKGAAALGAVSGHVWTVFLRFRGGKGVATAAGAFLGLAPLATLIAVAVWLVLVAATRIVSVGSMAGALALPISVYFVGRRGDSIPGSSLGPSFWLALAAAVVVLTRHRSNIRRLVEGNENRLTRVRKGSPS